jgi:membrane protease YdiL (CAAX protease family)
VVLGIFFIGVAMWVMVPVAYQIAQQSGDAGATTSPASRPLSIERAVPLTAATQVLALLAALGAGAMIRRDHVKKLGLSLRQFVGGLQALVPGMLMIMLPVIAIGALTAMLWQAMGLEHPSEHQMLTALSGTDNPLLRYGIFAAAWVLAPVSEEVMFRGLLQTALVMALTRSRTMEPRGFAVIRAGEAAFEPSPLSPARADVSARWIAIAMASAAFAFVHPWWSVPPIFFLSVCLGYAYERTGNLWVPIVLHSAFNTTQTLLFLSGIAGKG